MNILNFPVEIIFLIFSHLWDIRDFLSLRESSVIMKVYVDDLTEYLDRGVIRVIPHCVFFRFKNLRNCRVDVKIQSLSELSSLFNSHHPIQHLRVHIENGVLWHPFLLREVCNHAKKYQTLAVRTNYCWDIEISYTCLHFSWENNRVSIRMEFCDETVILTQLEPLSNLLIQYEKENKLEYLHWNTSNVPAINAYFEEIVLRSKSISMISTTIYGTDFLNQCLKKANIRKIWITSISSIPPNYIDHLVSRKEPISLGMFIQADELERYLEKFPQLKSIGVKDEGTIKSQGLKIWTTKDDLNLFEKEILGRSTSWMF